MTIYMDNAATRMGNFGTFNVNSPYAQEQQIKFEEARKKIANSLHCEAENIYFTAGGCEANSWALQRVGCKKIITTKIEHSSVMNCCRWLENHGYDVTYLNVDKHGLVDLVQLEEVLSEKPHVPTLVSIMYVNNELGTTQDLRAIRKIIDLNNQWRRNHSTETLTDFAEPIYFHSDCVQAVGQMDIPIECLDLMSASGHKFGNDYGVGFLYSRVPIQPLIFGGSQEHGLRGGTSNYKAILRMADCLVHKQQDIIGRANTITMVNYLRDELEKFDCIINTPKDSKSSILSVSFKGVDAERLMIFLNGFGIYVSSGSACETDHKEHSHVLTAIGVPDDYINGTIRFSLSEYIGASHIDTVISLIKQFIGGFDGEKSD